jgi:pimeloyl-ACP methyl ester carboxylesterase
MEDCRDRLIDADVDLGGYTSRESARDLEDLRQVLGYEEWNLYGISYGSRLALTAMRDHPLGIRSAILDSVVPPHADLHADAARNASHAFVDLFRSCVEDPTCDRRYRSIGKAFYRLVERLHEEPVTIDGVEVAGDVAIGYLFDRLYMREAIPWLPSEIDAAVEGDYSALEAFLSELAPIPGPSASYHRSISEAVHASIDCAEEIPFTSVAAYDDASRGVRPELVDYFDPEWSRLLCRWWTMPAPDPVENEPVTSDIPTLLLAGRFDPITPEEWAHAAAEHLTDSQVVVFGGSGHGVLPGSDCAAALVETFLEQPGQPVDGTCADAEDVRFE